MSEEIPKPGYYAIIPAHVRYASIEANAKLLYGEITALCIEEGYCWAENEYFASLYDVKIRAVQNWIRSLKKIGAIKVDNPSNLEVDQRRKIWPCDDAKKMFTERRKVHGGMQKNASTHIYSNTTSEISPISPKGESNVSPKKLRKKREDTVQRNSRVWTTPSQHKYLLERAKESESLVQGWYDRLERWKVEKGYEGGNDFRHLDDWVPGAYDRDLMKNQAAVLLSKRVEKRRAWAAENEWSAPGGSASCTDSAYVIISGPQQNVYHYSDDSAFWKEKGL